MDPELAHLQYVYPTTLATGAGIMTGDGGFGGFNVDQDDLTGERETGLRLWQGKYKFRQEMLPAFVGEGFGSKVSDINSHLDCNNNFHLHRYSRLGRVSISFGIVVTTRTGLPLARK